MLAWFCSRFNIPRSAELVQHQWAVGLQGAQGIRHPQQNSPRTCQLAAVLSKANGKSASAALAEHIFAPDSKVKLLKHMRIAGPGHILHILANHQMVSPGRLNDALI